MLLILFFKIKIEKKCEHEFDFKSRKIDITNLCFFNLVTLLLKEEAYFISDLDFSLQCGSISIVFCVRESLLLLLRLFLWTLPQHFNFGSSFYSSIDIYNSRYLQYILSCFVDFFFFLKKMFNCPVVNVIRLLYERQALYNIIILVLHKHNILCCKFGAKTVSIYYFSKHPKVQKLLFKKFKYFKQGFFKRKTFFKIFENLFLSLPFFLFPLFYVSIFIFILRIYFIFIKIL